MASNAWLDTDACCVVSVMIVSRRTTLPKKLDTIVQRSPGFRWSLTKNDVLAYLHFLST
jgi:hypothetical protein